MYTEERADADSPAVEEEGRRGGSLKAGEKLRVEAAWNEEETEAESVKVAGAF